MDFNTTFKRIQELTDFSRKNINEVALSWQEELGELCAELKIQMKLPGTLHKKPSEDGVYGECADAWICSASLAWKQRDDLSYGVHITEATRTLDEYITQLVDQPFRVKHCVNQIAIMGIALLFDKDPIHFLQKINFKLDKWQRNVGYQPPKPKAPPIMIMKEGLHPFSKTEKKTIEKSNDEPLWFPYIPL